MIADVGASVPVVVAELADGDGCELGFVRDLLFGFALRPLLFADRSVPLLASFPGVAAAVARLVGSARVF
ncbi:hypothetical protein, partial [Mycobacteroides abscessus]|uniref:hypothetical protein n=1 Tax=Mycobacteroides abscessus TaxID=36809 RepID=UPI0010420D58